MYYNYEVTADYNCKKQKCVSIIATLLKICGGLGITVGLMMYRNLPWCLGLALSGVAVAVIGIAIDNYAARLAYVWQYIVNEGQFVVNIRYNNGDIVEHAHYALSDISLSPWRDVDGYVVYTVTANNDVLEIKSNKYLYALLRKYSQ